MSGQVEVSTQTELKCPKCRELRRKFLCLKRLFQCTGDAKIPRTRRWRVKIKEKSGSTSKGTTEGY